jgi:hypothetical protein
MDEAPAVPAGMAQNLVQLRARAMARVAAPSPLRAAQDPNRRRPMRARPGPEARAAGSGPTQLRLKPSISRDAQASVLELGSPWDMRKIIFGMMAWL